MLKENNYKVWSNSVALCTILSSTHNFDNPNIFLDEKDLLKKVIIGEGTWIAWGVTILPGVTIKKLYNLC